MIRIVVALVRIGLILATALTRQVIANWVLSAGLAVYLLLRWRSRQARIVSSRQTSQRQAVAGQPRQSARVPRVAEHRQHPRARWHTLIKGEWHEIKLGLVRAAEAFFRRTINSTGCMPEHVVTDKGTFYPSAIHTYAPGAKHTATGFYNLVISTNRCERNHGYVKSRVLPMRGLKSFKCATRLFPALDGLQLVERDFMRVPPIGAPCTGGRSYVPLATSRRS